jgi:hypothetical protein
VQEMEDGWPSGVGLRGQALNRPVLRWLKTVVVSDREKARLDRARWGPGRRPRSARPGKSGSGVVVEASKTLGGIEIEVLVLSSRIELGGCPCIGQAVSGVEAA